MITGLKINVERLRREIVADRKGAEIARKLGISPSYLYRKLGGEVSMSLDDLNKICFLYGRDATEFVDEISLEAIDENKKAA